MTTTQRSESTSFLIYRCFGCLGTSFTEGTCDHCGKPVPVACRPLVKAAA